MSETLATKYRPHTFHEVVGQGLTATILEQMVLNETVPKALLFTGPSGVGKTTVARILAASLNHEEDWTVNNPNVIEIDAASNASVADVRQLVESVRYVSTGKRVIILDEAHNMSKEAFNALLKPIEESEGTYFILITTESHKIPDTIKSRLIEFPLSGVSPDAVYQRLWQISTAEEYGPEQELLSYIALNSNGNMRNAIMDLDLCKRASINKVDTYKELREDRDIAPQLINILMTGDHKLIFGLISNYFTVMSDPSVIYSKLIEGLRDIMVLQAGGSLTVTGPSLTKREEIAAILETERILAAFRVLWDLKTRVRAADNVRSNLDLSLVLIADVFTKGKEVAPKVTAVPVAAELPSVVQEPEAPQELSLADLQKMESL